MGLNLMSILFITICFLIFKKHSVHSIDESNKQKLGIDKINRQFLRFIFKYNKMYSGIDEYSKRLKIFQKNVEEINKRNEQYCDVKFAVNKFADMTEIELNRYFGLVNNAHEKCSSAKPEYRFNGTAPEQFDWREHNVVTAPKNQGACGSCWAFCTVGAIESRYAIKHHVLYRLSEQQLLDCSKKGNCDGADFDEGIRQAMTDRGVVMECDYMHKIKKNKCHVLGKKRKATVESWGLTWNMESEDLLKEIVYNNGPVAVGVHTGVYWTVYSDGVASAESLNCKIEETNHAVVIVGYGVTKDDNKIPFWIIKNSWGEDWGENGYIRLKRGENACNVLEYVLDIFTA